MGKLENSTALTGEVLTLETAERLKNEAHSELTRIQNISNSQVGVLNSRTSSHGLLDVLMSSEFDEFATDIGNVNQMLAEAYQRYSLLSKICRDLKNGEGPRCLPSN